jgi:ElaB/YqjD/DUF883 family membrane-anchored ribosome-binding protein
MSKTEPVMDIETIKADLAALRDDVTTMASAKMRDGAVSVKKAAKAVRDSAVSAVERTEHMVAERPLTSLALAFGAGALAAFLLRRR